MGGQAEYELIEGDDGGTTLALSGPYLVSTIAAVDEDIRAIEVSLSQIDLSGVTEIDTVVLTHLIYRMAITPAK